MGHSARTIPIWQATVFLKPIVDQFMEGKITDEECRNQLFQAPQDFINQQSSA